MDLTKGFIHYLVPFQGKDACFFFLSDFLLLRYYASKPLLSIPLNSLCILKPSNLAGGNRHYSQPRVTTSTAPSNPWVVLPQALLVSSRVRALVSSQLSTYPPGSFCRCLRVLCAALSPLALCPLDSSCLALHSLSAPSQPRKSTGLCLHCPCLSLGLETLSGSEVEQSTGLISFVSRLSILPCRCPVT